MQVFDFKSIKRTMDRQEQKAELDKNNPPTELITDSDTDGAVFIGKGSVFLKLSPDGTVSLHGTQDTSEAVQAVLDGIKIVIGLNPYYNKDAYPNGYGLGAK